MKTSSEFLIAKKSWRKDLRALNVKHAKKLRKEGFSYQEIADILEISSTTARKMASE